MIGYRMIEPETYPRKAHLAYFMGMERPQFNITADVDVTELRRFCQEKGYSFFLSFLHIVALSADAVPQLRQRIRRLTPEEILLRGEAEVLPGGIEIREYAECPTSHTETAGNGTYCYCALHHHMPWEQYIRMAEELQRKAREKGSLEEDPEIEAFYFPTCIPWIHYRDVVHPMTDRFDSNPRFSWGKYEEDFRGRLMMPLTAAVHHGLVDGLHIAEFYRLVEENTAKLISGGL
ncbi:MAG: CatA-like O-acetyltransferase [Clostridia bacterium]|nr:CatA-like O-acetyltransferase [Clostridia bacterium]